MASSVQDRTTGKTSMPLADSGIQAVKLDSGSDHVFTARTPTTTTHNSAATTNATVAKASAGTLYTVVASNVNAAARYLKLYNKATAPVVGTDVPVLTVAIPATGVVSLALGELGVRFSAGISFALTAGAADADVAAVAANEQKVVLSYI